MGRDNEGNIGNEVTTSISLKQRGCGRTYLLVSFSNETYHFDDFNFCIDSKMIEEQFQILFHLDAVVFKLRYSEDTGLAILPNLCVRW